MRNLYILIFILVTMMFISCNKNKEPYINVDAECVTIDSDGKAVAVNIVSNCTWSLETSNNWIKVKRGTGDNSLLISAAKNTSPENRTGSVTIKGNGVSSVIKVVQEQRNTISVDGATSISLDSNAQTFSITLLFNTLFEIKIPSDTTWLMVVENAKSLDNKEIVFSIKENTNKSAREANISITATGCQSITLKVIQAGAKQSLRYVVSGVTDFTAPLLGNKGNQAFISYDGTTVEYSSGISLPVKSETEFVIESPEIQTIFFEQCSGLESIDFSEL